MLAARGALSSCLHRSSTSGCRWKSLHPAVASVSQRQAAVLVQVKPPDQCMHLNGFPPPRLKSRSSCSSSGKKHRFNQSVRFAFGRKHVVGQALKVRSFELRTGASTQLFRRKVRLLPVLQQKRSNIKATSQQTLNSICQKNSGFGSPGIRLKDQERRRRSMIVSAAKWWQRWSRRQDSDLHKDRPPGLPLTMRGIEPLPPEEMEARLKCDVEKEVRLGIFCSSGVCSTTAKQLQVETSLNSNLGGECRRLTLQS
jgi:hypothetical protein